MTTMRPETSRAEFDPQETLLALLRAVCDEVYSLGCDVISLGDTVTNGLSAEPGAKQICDLQSFDLIGQRAIAQARLLQGIEQLLSSDEHDHFGRVDALIEAVPFHAERQRLFAACYRKDVAPHQCDRADDKDDDLGLF